MSLTYGLQSASDLFAKLQRDAAALDEEVTSDKFFNFLVTGYSLVDWIKKDPSVSASAKADLKRLRAEKAIQVCRDLANGSKHFTLNYSPITNSAISESGYGAGRYGKGVYGAGEESIRIQLNDGTSFHCLDLVREVLAALQSFFSAHGI